MEGGFPGFHSDFRGGAALPLRSEWADLLREFPRLGRIVCVTRNEAGFHERRGSFEQVDFYDRIGVVLGEEIDLRLFMEQWRYGFAVAEHGADAAAARRSFRFFDAHGLPILTVGLLEQSNGSEYDSIVRRFMGREPAIGELSPPVPPPEEWLESTPDAATVAAFRQRWLELEDTAYFGDLLKKFHLSREQGLRLAPEGYARQVDPTALFDVLEESVRRQLRIMIFMRSSGCLQIHTGAVRNLAAERRGGGGDGRVAIADGDFAFELGLEAIGSAWVVRKPTLDGDITSLELFDRLGRNVALFFGKRGRGQTEDFRWRAILGAC